VVSVKTSNFTLGCTIRSAHVDPSTGNVPSHHADVYWHNKRLTKCCDRSRWASDKARLLAAVLQRLQYLLAAPPPRQLRRSQTVDTTTVALPRASALFHWISRLLYLCLQTMHGSNQLLGQHLTPLVSTGTPTAASEYWWACEFWTFKTWIKCHKKSKFALQSNTKLP